MGGARKRGVGNAEQQYGKDITGLSLSNPNIFSRRMEVRDPGLFIYDDDKKYGAYSRICPWNVRRQPVMLTEEEKKKIDEDLYKLNKIISR